MIIIRGLNKAFGEKIIFSNFNLEIPDGSFVVISGDSGSGKSTLLNMIGGIEKPDSGSIIIEGLNITRLKNKNSFFADTVGFLFQNFALLENKTVKENLSLIKKSSRTKVSLKEALNRVGLSKEVNKKVYQLSGGEQQRVALARLMMKKCSVVLADEPTGSLDKKNRDIVMRLLHELNEEGKTVIIVTHDQGIIEDEPYLFRSRLEARWAVFFDAMGIEWEYEPEGIVLSDGTNYLPDFYLPHFHCYFEVKRRSIKGTPEEERVISKISNGEYTDSWAGMICFGDPMDDDLYIFCQEMDDGGGGSYENPVTIGFHPETHEPYLFAYNDRRDRTFFTHFGEDMEDSYIPMVTHEYGAYQYRDFVNKRVYRARELARQARFEYGETPRIRRSYR